MKNYRKWGQAPFSTAVLHGGPGMPGDVAFFAKELSHQTGVLEPIQTRFTINDLTTEVKNIFDRQATFPIKLIGHSWGAMLAFIFTAQYPEYVEKLILVDSGEFEKQYAAEIMNTRMSRLTQEEGKELHELIDKIYSPSAHNKDDLFKQMGPYIHKTDGYDEIDAENPYLSFSYNMYEKIWNEAEELRNSGELLKFGKKIPCPVTVIHGDYDPHPFTGIKASLSQVLTNVNFVLLEKSGHYPWLEKQARQKFYEVLESELAY